MQRLKGQFGDGMKDRRLYFGLVAFLLLGALLRLDSLGAMQDFLHFDEATNGLDALSLLEQPRLTPYFPANTGRESLWMYLLAPSLAVFGAESFALRIVAMFSGILSLAAVYALAREFLGGRGAVWAVGALAVLYWHVHLSHLAFRVNLFPLVGALAFAAILRARRLNRGWVWAGGWLGALSYTYTAARVWVILGGLLLLAWGSVDRDRRRGALLALGIAVAMGLPLGAALLTAPENTQVLASNLIPDLETFWQNSRAWAEAWFVAGDAIDTHNVNSRPILDLPLALLALAGIGGGWFVVRRKWLLGLWLVLWLLSFSPSLLAIYAPHFLRGAGLILPTALLLGAGGALLSRWRYGWLLPAALIAWAGVNSGAAFGEWVETVEYGLVTYFDRVSDYELNQALATIRAETPPDMPLLIPAVPEHAVLRFRAAEMPQRTTYHYDWREEQCLLLPRETAVALDLPGVLNDFAGRTAPYADLEVIERHPGGHHNIFRVEPKADLRAEWDDFARIGEGLRVSSVAPTSGDVQPGQTLTLHLGLRLSQPLVGEYRFFVHLQGDPTPYEGGTLWSTGDAPLCSLAAREIAAGEVTLVQRLALPIPADLQPGEYHAAIGLYDPATNDRLPLQTPSGETRYYEALRFRIPPGWTDTEP